MLLLLLTACSNDYDIKGPSAPEPLSLTLTSPTYGAFLGAEGITVSGIVTPASAYVQVNGTAVPADELGAFTTVLAFDDRAVVVDVTAIAFDERVRQIVPVFDGTDPRAADPGAIAGLLTPTGLDALEPMVADLVDSLGWQDLILSALPPIDTEYVDLTPVSVTSSGTTADLAPGFDSISLAVTLHDVTILTDVTVLDAYTFQLGVSLGEVGMGAHATPWIDADGMLGLSLADAIVDIGDITMSVEGWEIPEWITDLLLDPVADLVSSLGAGIGDLLLDQVGELPIGGPFAFDFDLLGTRLAAQLVEVDAGGQGVSLGATVGYGEDAADAMPEVATLGATTPSGLSYELGAAVHEGMFNVLLDETLAGFLDIDLMLEGEYGALLGSGIAALDGGNEMPDDTNGYCIALHVGEARVIRMVPGAGTPLARAYLPDVQVGIETVIDGECEEWLQASVFAVIDLTLDGTEVSADFDVRDVAVLEYGAENYDLAGVEEQLGSVVEGLAGLLGGQLSFDLGDALGGLGGFGITPEVVAIEPLDDDGLYGVYLNVFGTDL
jgi:hypothetical protein